jgi:NAD(P)-dependent dehydrogenase (short-subunit alcohol dehydrogenase family)
MRIILTGSEGFLGKNISDYLNSLGHEVISLDLKLGHDLSDELFVRSWFSDNSAEVLINCFAINDHVLPRNQREGFLDVSLQSFSEVLSVNVTSLFSVSREFIRNNITGKIINFSSIYSMVSPRSDIYSGGEKYIGYGVSKAAVNQITRHLAVHAAPNFSVNTIILGGVFNEQHSDFVNAYSENVPMRRMGKPSDLNPVLEMLISPGSSYMTGSQILIDGGWTVI